MVVDKVYYDAALSTDIWQDCTYGLPVFFLRDLSERSVPCIHPSPLDNLYVAKEVTSRELKLGRIAGPFKLPPFFNIIISAFDLIPKKEQGKFRLIHDLSFPRVTL